MQPKQILLLAFTLGVTSEAKVLPFARSENSLLDKLLAKRDSDGKPLPESLEEFVLPSFSGTYLIFCCVTSHRKRGRSRR